MGYATAGAPGLGRPADQPRVSPSGQKASRELQTLPAGWRRGGPDAGPGPEGGASAQTGDPGEGSEGEGGMGPRSGRRCPGVCGPGSPHGGAAGPLYAGTWTP